MTELGITHVYDLRSRNEIERSQLAGRGGVAEWDGCKRVFAPGKSTSVGFRRVMLPSSEVSL